MTRKKEALQLHADGANCAQAVLLPFCERYGLDRNTAIRLAGGLGGGMRVGDVCGAASGAVLAVGLRHGATLPEDGEAKKLCGEKTAEFIQAFRERFGHHSCRDLLKANGRKICPQVIAGAVELLEENGY